MAGVRRVGDKVIGVAGATLGRSFQTTLRIWSFYLE